MNKKSASIGRSSGNVLMTGAGVVMLAASALAATEYSYDSGWYNDRYPMGEIHLAYGTYGPGIDANKGDWEFWFEADDSIQPVFFSTSPYPTIGDAETAGHGLITTHGGGHFYASDADLYSTQC